MSTYIWGAGHYGALAALDCEKRGEEISGFLDANIELYGKNRLGYKIFSPEEIIPNRKKSNIIIAVQNSVDEIADELEKNGYEHGLNFFIYADIKRNYNGLRRHNRKMQINDLELIENIDILFKNDIVLYGAKACGKETQYFLKNAGVTVAFFCDGDSSKWGGGIDSIKILSPDELKRLDSDKKIVIIIASLDSFIIDQIINSIANLNLNTNKVYTRLALNLSIIQNINDKRINEAYRNRMIFSDKLRKNMINDYFNIHQCYLVIPRCIEQYNNILVYQPAKVGSTTIVESLNKLGINCAHLHFFNAWKNKASDYYQNLYKNMESVKIITLVREPISRLLSLIFYLIIYFDDYFKYLPSGTKLLDLCIKNLRWQNFEAELYRYNQFDWFDNELKAVFDIDIYSYPFDKEKGFSIFKKNNIELLAIKLEKLNTLESVIGNFINVPHFKLENSNEGENKIYKYLYKNVKDSIKIPKEIFSEYYENNQKMNHFYSEEEKVNFLKKWEKNLA